MKWKVSWKIRCCCGTWLGIGPVYNSKNFVFQVCVSRRLWLWEAHHAAGVPWGGVKSLSCCESWMSITESKVLSLRAKKHLWLKSQVCKTLKTLQWLNDVECELITFSMRFAFAKTTGNVWLPFPSRLPGEHLLPMEERPLCSCDRNPSHAKYQLFCFALRMFAFAQRDNFKADWKLAVRSFAESYEHLGSGTCQVWRTQTFRIYEGGRWWRPPSCEAPDSPRPAVVLAVV